MCPRVIPAGLSPPPGNWDLVTRERGKMDGDTVDTGRVTRLLGSDHENFSFLCFDTNMSFTRVYFERENFINSCDQNLRSFLVHACHANLLHKPQELILRFKVL